MVVALVALDLRGCAPSGPSPGLALAVETVDPCSPDPIRPTDLLYADLVMSLP
jgi:hypothetical protein